MTNATVGQFAVLYELHDLESDTPPEHRCPPLINYSWPRSLRSSSSTLSDGIKLFSNTGKPN